MCAGHSDVQGIQSVRQSSLMGNRICSVAMLVPHVKPPPPPVAPRRHCALNPVGGEDAVHPGKDSCRLRFI